MCSGESPSHRERSHLVARRSLSASAHRGKLVLHHDDGALHGRHAGGGGGNGAAGPNGLRGGAAREMKTMGSDIFTDMARALVRTMERLEKRTGEYHF